MTFRAIYYPGDHEMTWAPIIAADTEEEALERLYGAYNTLRAAVEILSVVKLHASSEHREPW